MNNRRLLYLTLAVATLGVGVLIGSIVSGGVKATAEQQKSATLVIPDPVSLSNVFSQVAAEVDPAVVQIKVESPGQPVQLGRGRRLPSIPDLGGLAPPAPRPENGLGSGFIVDKAGYILTNHHVVENATKMTVELDDKTRHTAKLIGSDKATDVAVIKIDVGRDLPFARLGNSDAVRIGDWVLAVGSPFGFDHTVTAGIISAKGRSATDVAGPADDPDTVFQSFLQTDAAINPGNSGGPLVSMTGEVIGLNTAIVSETRGFAGLGFALPSNIAIKVYNQLVQTGKVTRGSIGIMYEEEPAVLSAFGQKNGVVVKDVIRDMPASKAGIRADDVITEIDGTKIVNGGTLLDLISNTTVGRTLQIKVVRDGREMSFPVQVGDRAVVLKPDGSQALDGPDKAPAGPVQAKLGIGVQAITNQMMRQFGLPTQDGVIIASVETGSAADNAGLDRGMVITQVVVGGEVTPIRGVDEFNTLMRGMKSGTQFAFRVVLGSGRNDTRYVPLTMP